MTDSSTVSIADRVAPISLGAMPTAVHFLPRTVAFVTGEAEIVLLSDDGSERRVAAHAGGIIAAASDGASVITGGDDGRLVATGADGAATPLATDPRKRWVDHVAAGPDGAVAWSVGRTAHVRTVSGQVAMLELPSGVGGIAFAPRGFRLAIAHYNGVTLWFPKTAATPERLDWKGSHVAVTLSPDGKFVVTAMQEPTLHGWRLADRKHMRMSGYSAKVRSFSWSAGGKWLATAGSEQLILWPFAGKDGPMGKQPRMLAPRETRVVAVACSPVADVAAVGYADGMVLLVRIDDGAEILAHRPSGSAVAALAWSRGGERFAFATESGSGGVLML